MSECIEVVTTTETQEEARRIARLLVEARLAGCVQIRGPIESVYRWKGQIETAQEWQCVAKTRRDCFSRVERAIQESHSYDVPEILAVPIVEVSDSYAQWLGEQVS